MRNILLSAFAILLTTTPANAKWREASTSHFVVYSEEDEKSLQEFASRLERFDAVMRQMQNLPDINPGPANRVTVYVVSNASAVQKLSGLKGNFVAGFYNADAANSRAIIPRKYGNGEAWNLDEELILFHEYAHHFLFQNYTAAYPAWFSEGFAEFYATAKFEKDGGVEIGVPAQHRAYGLHTRNPMPISTLLTYGTKKISAEQLDALYGRGWLLTHYLMFEPSRQGQLNKYLNVLNNGKTGLDAAAASFGDLKTLDKDLNHYLKSNKFLYRTIPASLIKTGPITIRELGPGADALMELKIRSRNGVTRDQAKKMIPEVRKLAAPYPNDVAAQETLAEAEYDANNLKEAEAAVDRALAVDDKAIHALIYKGMIKMQLAIDSKDAAAWKEARRWFSAANKIDPDNPEPLILFYNSFGAQKIPVTKNAVAGLLYAFQLVPQDQGLRTQVARQLLVDGKAKEARMTIAPIAYNPHAGEFGEFMTKVIAAIDAGGASEGLKTWDALQKEAEEKEKNKNS